MRSNATVFNLCQLTERELDVYIDIEGYRFEAGDKLKNFKMNEKIHIDGDWIGQAIPKQLEFELNWLDDLTIDFKRVFGLGSKVELFHGIKRPDDIYEYEKVGIFYIDRVDINAENRVIKILCFDYLKKLQDIRGLNITYPVTVRQLVNTIAESYDFQVDTNLLLFGNFEIPNEIYFGNNPSIIDVFKTIAGANICFVSVDNNNVVKFKRLFQTGGSFTNDILFKSTLLGYVPHVTTVVISRMPQEDNVYFDNESNPRKKEVKLINNPILDLDREYFVEGIYNIFQTDLYIDLFGVNNLVMLSNPVIECGDIYHFGSSIHAVLEHTLTLTRSEIQSPIPKNLKTDFTRAKSVEEQIKETVLYVDKVRGEIVSEVSLNVDERISQVIQTDESIVSKVSYQQLEDVTNELNEKLQVLHNYATSIEQTGKDITLRIENYIEADEEHKGNLEEKVDKISTAFEFKEDGLYISNTTSPFSVRLSNDKLSFMNGTAEMSYFSNDKLYIQDAEILRSIVYGNYEFYIRKRDGGQNGNTTWRVRR